MSSSLDLCVTALLSRIVPVRKTRLRKNQFNICERIHEAEYKTLGRPNDPKGGKLLEPAHKLEITLEPDTYTEEKSGLLALEQ